ncbi:hypothetical protein NHQ30_001775 [Ciborinia camelliae]|nr:hypothetical protein NHQ30_001775 [Ciborinia camelliae]
MSSTPMAIDSPMGANGNSILKANGVSSVPSTAKLTEMISLYTPVKVGVIPANYEQLLMHEAFPPFSDTCGQGPNSSNTKKDPKLNKIVDKIRYLSAHDNSYIRYFEGHEQNVTCLSLHPGQDNFISCSEDNTLRIWDAASNNPAGILNLTGVHLVAWDPSGNVFATASPLAQSILLYDFRNFDKEPFATFDILPFCQEFSPQAIGRGWNKLAFSNDGKHLLLGTTGNGHFLLDAFDGHLKAFLRRDRGGARRLGAGDHNPDNLDPASSEYLHTTAGDCCFTPDGRYVISGSRGKNVLVWDTLAATSNRVLSPLHELEYAGDSAIVAFNPKYNHFATADQEVLFWVPNTDML